jgi:hypothetical protein
MKPEEPRAILWSFARKGPETMQGTYCSATGTHPTRLPRGWKRSHDSHPICAKCRGERYILRAVTIPIVGTVVGTWKELRDDLRDASADATALSNRLTTEYYVRYYVRDVRRNGHPTFRHGDRRPGDRVGGRGDHPDAPDG